MYASFRRKVYLPLRCAGRTSIGSYEFVLTGNSKGPVVLHQWPPGSITRDQRSKRQPLLDVLSISEYLVPRQDLCNQLISTCIDDYRVIGYPMCIIDSDKYARHEFIYNFCVVIKEHIEFSTYERAVSQTAWLLAAAEEQEDFLQRNEEDLDLDSSTELDEKPAVPRLQAFCENFMEDLNRYNECIIPISMYETRTILQTPGLTS